MHAYDVVEVEAATSMWGTIRSSRKLTCSVCTLQIAGFDAWDGSRLSSVC